ncbi:hypothetical protein ES705_33467 [subsurface metagenome]
MIISGNSTLVSSQALAREAVPITKAFTSSQQGLGRATEASGLYTGTGRGTGSNLAQIFSRVVSLGKQMGMPFPFRQSLKL